MRSFWYNFQRTYFEKLFFILNKQIRPVWWWLNLLIQIQKLVYGSRVERTFGSSLHICLWFFYNKFSQIFENKERSLFIKKCYKTNRNLNLLRQLRPKWGKISPLWKTSLLHFISSSLKTLLGYLNPKSYLLVFLIKFLF